MSDERIHDRIQFRLRSVDADLREAVKGLPTQKISELARDGLRLILGIRTTKRVEVTEKPIIQHRQQEEQPATITQGPGTVWKKQK